MKEVFSIRKIVLMLILSVVLVGCSNQSTDTNNLEKNKSDQEIIVEQSTGILEALRDFNTEKLSTYIHPTKGVRFSQYTDLTPNDLNFTKQQVANFKNDSTEYLWGYYDGSGFDIELTPKEYFEEFVYTVDYITNSDKIGYNEVVSTPLYEGNYKEYFQDAFYIEYFHKGTEAGDYFDWKSLRLVFEKYEDTWYLVGFIHSENTV